MADQVIGIQFGVAGGGSIDGESGQRIKKQLEAIASDIKLQVNIDKDYFVKQLPQLKSELEKQLGKLPINIRTNVSASSSSVGVTPSGNVGTSQSAHSAGYNAIVQAVEKAKVEAKQLFSILNQDTDFFGIKNENYQGTLAKLNAQIEEFKVNMTEALNNGGIDVVDPQELIDVDKLKDGIRQVEEETMRITQAKQDDKLVNMQAGYDGLRAKVQQLNKTHVDLIKHNKDAAAEMQRLQDLANQPLSSNFSEANAQIRTLTEETRKASARFDELEVKTDTIGTKLRKTFTSKILQTFAYLLITLATRAMRQVYQNVVKIDKAMTSLRIVTKANSDEIKSFTKSVTQSAKKIGKSVDELINSTTVFARLGYSLKEAAKLAEKTTMYSNVSGVAVDEATTNITAIVKAFNIGADEVESVLDKLIYVGNNFAISSGEIGEGMNNAASALAANGNTLEEAIGILTAANVTVQNASKSSTAVRTIAARMSASVTELEELGEGTEGVLSTAKLAEKMNAYGISIVNVNGNLRSTYDVLSDIAKIWDQLGTTDQSAIAGMLAGTRQQNAFYSIMQNWSDAEKVVKKSTNAYRELQNANEEYLNSIEGKTEQLKASWQDFSVSILDSDIVKFFVDVARVIANILTAIIKLGDGAPVKISLVIVAVYGLSVALKALQVVIGADLPAALLRLKAAVLAGAKSIGAAMLALLKTPYFWIGLIIASLVLWGKKMPGIAQAIVSGVLLIGSIIAITLYNINAKVHAFMASNPLGWILAVVTAIVAAATLAVKAINKLINKNVDAAKKAEEASKAARDLADEAAEESKSLSDLIQQYKEVASSEFIDASKREKIRDIQKQINKLVGQEADGIDAVNGKLDDTYKRYKQLQLEDLKGKDRTFIDSYDKAKTADASAYYSYNDKSGFARFWRGTGLTNAMTFTDKYYSPGPFGSGNSSEIYRELQKISGLNVNPTGYGDMSIDYTTSGAKARLKAIQDAIDVVESGKYYSEMKDSNLYSALKSARSYYDSLIQEEEDSSDALLEHFTSVYGLAAELRDDTLVNSIDSFNSFRDNLIRELQYSTELSDAIADGFINFEEIENEVDNYMYDNFRAWYNKNAELIRKENGGYRGFLSILEEVQDKFDALSDVLNDIEEQGVSTGDSIKELLQNYPELAKYFKLTTQGYMLNSDYVDSIAVLDEFQREYLQEYEDALKACTEGTEEYTNALNQRNRALAVFATLRRTSGSADNLTVKSLNAQLDAIKEIVDIRKDLLKTYADEISYQKTLAQKQKTVADLQTRLTLATLDKSAAGQANARKIQDELDKAKDELDDYTLEHAINIITDDIDSTYNDYKKFIEGLIDGVKEEISKAAAAIEGGEDVPDILNDGSSVAGGTAGGSNSYFEQAKKYILDHGMMQGDKARWGQDPNFRPLLNQLSETEYSSLKGYTYGEAELDADGKLIRYKKVPPVYHSGGFVGDESTLKSNELYAKLLKGEFVATPAQMDSFIKTTVPALASRENGASIQYNSPLIEINCDSITEDSLPKLKDIIDMAVGKIKTEMSAALGRTGYRKSF